MDPPSRTSANVNTPSSTAGSTADSGSVRSHERRDEERQDEGRQAGPRAAAGRRDDRDLGERAQGDRLTAPGKWPVLRKKEKPAAEIFSVSYVAEGDGGDRPVTFVFNGGPGASSAYLHMGAVGPQRVDFPSDGTLPAMPREARGERVVVARVHRSRLRRPVGTGWSRVIEPEKKGDGKEGGGGAPRKPDDAPDPKEYFGYKRDLESMCEFMGRWLSEHGRWGSPVFIAGESYGGYRVGRLARMLQETAGIGLNGAILISPALEITPLNPTDYDVLGWIDRVPTMAAAAFHHGRSRAFRKGSSLDKVFRDSEEFATGDYTAFLTRGASMPAKERARILSRLADIVGLPEELVVRAEGRVGDPDVRARAPARRAQDPGALRLDDHGNRPVPGSRRVLVAGSDALRDHSRIHDGREPDAALGDRRRDGPRVHAALLRGQHGVEAGHRAPRVRARRPARRTTSGTAWR